ncbi:AsmA family protein [Caldimonas tepidiphila]|uniref:AsmA family protein n=1 Tax=Caldimonas tepidiphila TaxID=2315841 RepID=UPI0013006D08|nr:AsmA family protein [Caldimonas tepidiphila]
MVAKFSEAPRWLRWTLGALGALLLVLLLCEALGWRFAGGPIERMLQRQLQREVSLKEGFRMHLLGPIRLKTDLLRIGPPAWAEGEQARPLVEARSLNARLPWSTLFAARRGGEPLHVSAFEVDTLEALLHRTADGRANWQFGPSDPADKKASELELPVFDRLTVRDGRVTVLDQPLKLAADARIRTHEGRDVQAGSEGAGLRIDAEGRYRGEPLFLRLASSGALALMAKGEGVEPVPVRIEAGVGETRFDFDGRVREALRLTGFDGRVSFSGPTLGDAGSLFGVTLPSTAKFDGAGRLQHEGQVWRLAVERLTVGGSRLAGDFAFDVGPETPLLQGELRGERLVLADLAPAFGAGTGGKSEPRRGGRVLPDREFDLPALKAMNAEVKVDLKEVRLGDVFAQQIRPLQGVIGLRGAVLSVDRLVARTADGELGGRLVLDASERTAQWRAQLRWAGIRLERWLSPRNPTDERARTGQPPPSYVSGVLSGRADLRGRGRSAAELLGSLDGEATTWVQNGRISHLVMEGAGLDLAQALGVVIKGDQPLAMNCAVTRIEAKDGRLRPDVAVIDTADTTVLVDGAVSLREERLNLTLRARPKDFSPLTLRAPVHVQGSFSEPQVRLDTAAIGGKAAAAAALAALVSPLAAVLPFIDPGTGDEPGCRQAVAKLGGAGQVEAAREVKQEAERDASGTPAKGR